MAYVRRDKDCNLVTQPNHVNRTDVYGNTYEDWCADYDKRNVDNVSLGIGCAPILYTVVWEHRDVDNNVRLLSPYQKNPLFPNPFWVPEPTGTLILVAEQDRDIQFYTESNTLQLQLEDNTVVESVVTTQNLISEIGDVVITEDGETYDIVDGVVVGVVPTD